MKSKATTVQQYLAELPTDRRKHLSIVRNTILKYLPSGYEEGIQYGMIGYYVPHRIYAPGYHCDPDRPLPFAGLASQKSYMSIYLMCIYGHPQHDEWFRQAWLKTGKKLDMGKSCVRFRSADEVPLAVIGQAIKRVPVKKFIEHYEAVIQRPGGKRPRPTKAKKKTAAKPAVKSRAAKRKSSRRKTSS